MQWPMIMIPLGPFLYVISSVTLIIIQSNGYYRPKSHGSHLDTETKPLMLSIIAV